MPDRLIYPLLFIPNPREIPEFLESVSKLYLDKYWVKYNSEPEAYRIARRAFLYFGEYTHIVICSDDLVFPPESLEILLKDLEKEDYPVLSGICNVDMSPEYRDKYAICVNKMPPLYNITLEGYQWMTEAERQRLLKEKPIWQVKHSGFCFMFVRRDIVDKIPFRPTRQQNCCLDTQFCWDCHDLEIPIHVDLRANGLHLKNLPNSRKYWKVGEKNPVNRLERY